MLASVSVVLGIFQIASALLPARDVVVLSHPHDPYRNLALEIASAESTTLVESLSEIASLGPMHVLWVTAPATLSDEEMIEAGLFLKDHPDIAVGIITGSTPDRARALWRRAAEASGTRAAFAIAKDPRTGVGIPIGLTVDRPQGRSVLPLTKASFATALTEMDYVTFAGHGGPSSLGLPNGVRFGTSDIPTLPPVVVATGSCNALRPWANRPLAVTFADSGAAAFAGFAYSPIAGYLLGQYRDLAFRQTWPGVTVGETIQLQNQGTLHAFARFPFFFLVGDPRLHLRSSIPYRVRRDTVLGDERILELEDVASGVVPIRIPNAADYDFVRIPGLGSAAASDLFYNGRIQMMNMGEDRLLLVVQETPALTVILRRSAPGHRAVSRPLTDALDHTFVFLPQTGIPAPTLGVVVFLAVFLWGLKARKGDVRRASIKSLVAGGVPAAIVGLYTLLRHNDVVVTSKAITPSALVPIDFFFLFSAAALLFTLSRSWRGRTFAILLGAIPALGPAMFSLLGFTVMNFRLSSVLATSLYTHHMGVMSLISTVLLVLSLVLSFTLTTGRVSTTPEARRSLSE